MPRSQFFSIKANLKTADKIKAYFVCFLYWAVNFLVSVVSFILWPNAIKSSKKICIYKIGNIGDIIYALPAFHMIRRNFPEAHITLLTSPGKRGMIGAEEIIWNKKDYFDELMAYYTDEIWKGKAPFELIRKIRARSFDLFICLPSEKDTFYRLLRLMLFAKFCRVKKAGGFRVTTLRSFYHVQFENLNFICETERLLKIIRETVALDSESDEFNLPIPVEAKNEALEIIKRNDLAEKSIFAFVPGAKREENRWPIQHFIRLGNMLLKEYPLSKIIILGGQEEKEKGEVICNNLIDKSSTVNLAGKTSLWGCAALLNYVAVVISNNTGIMHIAALQNIRTVGIFSAAELP